MRRILAALLTLTALTAAPQEASAAPPGVLSTVSPSDSVAAPTNQPTYVWTGVEGATQYDLYIQNNGSAQILPVSPSVCDANLRCTHTPSVTLAPGNAWWAVRGYNVDGVGAWPSVSLTHFIAPSPTAPTAIGPSGVVINSFWPPFEWNAVPGATSYEFLLRGPDGSTDIPVKTIATSACTGTPSVCRYAPNQFVTGTNWWYVRALGVPFGPTAWRETSFVINWHPAEPEKVSPTGVLNVSNTKFVWKRVDGLFLSYYLQVQDELGNMLVSNRQIQESECGSDETLCQYTVSGLTFPLNRNIQWWVRAVSLWATSEWGTGMGFRYQLTPLVAPVAVSPLGIITTTVPQFKWRTVSGATNYDIAVVDSNGIVIQEQRYASSICTGSPATCTASPNKTIALGNAFWYVRAVTSTNTGNWSAAQGFYVNPAPPSVPVQVGPSGILGNDTPVFSWRAATGASSYEITLTDETGVRFVGTVTATCSGSPLTCTASPGATVNPGNAWWWVRSVGSTGQISAWAGPLSLRWQ